MKDLGFSWATKAGISIGIVDLCVPEAKGPICQGTRQRTAEAEHRCENGDITVVEKFLKVTGEWTKASESVKDEAIANFQENMPTNPVYMMSTSGARGSISQVRQLIAMRGLMADANGELIEVPISNSLRDGMTVTDMLISGHGARKGVIDTALRTAESGYLYRRLDFAVSHMVIRAEDCGTTKATDHDLTGIFQPSASLKDRIRGRTLAQDVVDPETGEVMFERGHLLTLTDATKVSKRWVQCDKAGAENLLPIRVRTPITCKLQDGMCSMCYGEDLSTPGKFARIGTPVGVIAAQSMGEPGTQLTMRTFHTGGAFEGGASKGVAATGAGRVRLVAEDGEPITSEGMSLPAGHWIRMPTGDTACLLKRKARIEVLADGEVAQAEDLEPDTLVKVQDGQAVSRGQALFEINASQLVARIEAADDDPDITRLPKPIVSDEGGEVVITDATATGSCLKDGSQLVWVLQGSSTTFENEAACSLAVRQGDVIAPGMPVATEWAVTRCAGVQRFQPAPPVSAAAAAARAAAPAAAGWRQLDWRREEEAEVAEEQAEEAEAGEDGERKGSEAAEEEEAGEAEAPDQVELCSRTDFDWFFFTGALAEYNGTFSLPAALGPQAETKTRWARDRGSKVRATQEAKEAVEQLKAVKPTNVSVYALSMQPEAEQGTSGAAAAEGAADGGSLGVICASDSRGAEGVVCPVSRTSNPEHTVPFGGLVFHLPRSAEDEGRALLWVPEEVHTLQVTKDVLRDLAKDHGRFGRAGDAAPGLQGSSRQSVLTLGVSGCFCVYMFGSRRSARPIGSPSLVAEEADGALRREARDRLCCSGEGKDAAEAGFEESQVTTTTVECVVKPGFIFACPSKFFDESWYTEAAAKRGLYFHQRVVPPGVPFVPGLPRMVSEEHWRVVELLDDPRAGPVCRVLVRTARRIVVPDDPEPLHPAVTRNLTSWHLPYAQGELVRSRGPVALAYEVLSSVSRHPGELHCATPVPAPAAPDGPRSPAPPAAPRAEQAASSEFSGMSLELVRESPLSTLCVVQHSPLGSPQPVSNGTWSEPPAKYIAPDQDERPSGAQATWLPTPRRQLASEGGGCVCRVDGAGSGRSTVVLLGPDDCARVPCRGRPTVPVGKLLRTGEALSDEDAAPFAGQVLLVEETGASAAGAGAAYQVTLRRARAHLVTPGGEVRVRSDAVVEPGDLLGTENLVVPRTTDITQGLPKITKLFEAAGGELQVRLEERFQEELKSHGNLEAAQRARSQLEQELVSEISSVYLEQGVFINGRHIEIVVSRMLSKCRVLSGGGLALKPGSLVDYGELEAIVALSCSSAVRVQPVIRGLTSIGKEDLHVFVSMGFRECDNIATEAIMNGPERYPMRGVKENLMMGKTINVGFATQEHPLWSDKEEKPLEQEELDREYVSMMPEWSDEESLGELLGTSV